MFRTKKFHFRNTNFLANITASLSIAYVNSNVMPKHAPGELRKSTLCYKYSANNVNNRLLLVSVSSVTQRNPFTLRSNILFRVKSYRMLLQGLNAKDRIVEKSRIACAINMRNSYFVYRCCNARWFFQMLCNRGHTPYATRVAHAAVKTYFLPNLDTCLYAL